jgi:quinol monooxygenase YgiN
VDRFFQVLITAASLLLATALPARAQDDPTMYMVIYVEVAAAAKTQGAALLKQLAAASRKDAGVIRFDVIQRAAVPSQFVILETWKDQQALDAHGVAAHTKQVREKLQPLLIAPIDDRLSLATSVGPVRAGGARGAVYVATHVDVSQANREKGIALLKPLADMSRKDPGSLRFEVLQQKARTNHFTVVEVWKDQKSNDAHELAAHTKDFREQLHPLVGALYDQRWYKAL